MATKAYSDLRANMRYAALIAVATAITLTPTLSAQDVTISWGEPADVGMSASVLDGAVGLYKESVERGDLVGAVLLVAKDGKAGQGEQ